MRRMCLFSGVQGLSEHVGAGVTTLRQSPHHSRACLYLGLSCRQRARSHRVGYAHHLKNRVHLGSQERL